MSSTSALREEGIPDEYGNRHYLVDELARGGQGVVYRTNDPDLAVKQPFGISGNESYFRRIRDHFRNVRCLPIPPRLPLAIPVAVLRDEPGYVMKLLKEMEPIGVFEFNGKARRAVAGMSIPDWLSGVNDEKVLSTLMHYSKSGSTKRRLGVLSILASILARIHAAGLVYCDVSPNNCFMSVEDPRQVWLIDADNLRFEVKKGGKSVYTPRYGAPELVRGHDGARPGSDAWAFAVMAFEMLTLLHPFVGQQVLQGDDGEDGWDLDPGIKSLAPDLYVRAYEGYLPFVDDESDTTNRAIGGLPRSIVLTPSLARLFGEMFNEGRVQPWRRPSLVYWSIELARAHDESVVCPSCSMSYHFELLSCPYCDAVRPQIAVFSTKRWKIVQQEVPDVVYLPHRLFNPFNLELHSSLAHEANVDFASKTFSRVQGEDSLPRDMSVAFYGAGQ